MENEDVLKLCLVCGEEKPLVDFYKAKGRKDGLYSYCRICAKELRTKDLPRVGLQKLKEEKDAAFKASIPLLKRCYCCKLEKSRDNFSNASSRRDGKEPSCKDCKSSREKKRAKEKREEKLLFAEPQDPNKKPCPSCKAIKPLEDFYTSSYSKTGRNSHCKECIKAKSKSRYKKDPLYREKLVSKRKRYYNENTEKCSEASKEWIKNNPEKAKKINRKRYDKKLSTIQGRLEVRVLGLIRQAVQRRVGPSDKPTIWPTVLGYTFDELKLHLESLFVGGMTWDKLVAGEIEIDHVIPRSAFVYETILDEDFKTCWRLQNLQPLWVSDNARKSDKMPDGSRGKDIGDEKRRLLKEENSIAGWENKQAEASENDICA